MLFITVIKDYINIRYGMSQTVQRFVLNTGPGEALFFEENE